MNIINKHLRLDYTMPFTTKKDISLDKNENRKKEIVAIGALAIGITTIGILSKKSRKEMVEKAGIELRDKLAYHKVTDKKFTGILKKNVLPFGLKKEVVEIEDGMLKEILNYGFNGKELNGDFYKNGKILYRSHSIVGNSKRKYYATNKYDENGNICLFVDGVLEPNESVFEHMRKLVKKEF